MSTLAPSIIRNNSMISRRARFLLPLLCLVSWTPGIASAAPDDEQSQRQLYSQALTALRQGHTARFEKLREALGDYPLQPYLDYELLKDRLASTPAAKLLEFLDRYPEAAVTDQLRRKWLKQLTERGDWSNFLAAYRAIQARGDLEVPEPVARVFRRPASPCLVADPPRIAADTRRRRAVPVGTERRNLHHDRFWDRS